MKTLSFPETAITKTPLPPVRIKRNKAELYRIFEHPIQAHLHGGNRAMKRRIPVENVVRI